MCCHLWPQNVLDYEVDSDEEWEEEEPGESLSHSEGVSVVRKLLPAYESICKRFLHIAGDSVKNLSHLWVGNLVNFSLLHLAD